MFIEDPDRPYRCAVLAHCQQAVTNSNEITRPRQPTLVVISVETLN